MTDLSLQDVAKYNRRRTPADHALIYAMAEALGAIRYVEKTGSSYMKGVSCLDARGVEQMFVAAGRAYIRPESEPLLTAAGIDTSRGVVDNQRVVLFSNAGNSNEVARGNRVNSSRPFCSTCWMELPATGVCDNC